MQHPDFIFNLKPGDIVWDIETYPNVFTAYFLCADTDQEWFFEISPWVNDIELLCAFIDRCRQERNRWVGFNSLGFDYPVVHFIYQNHRAHLSAADIYTKAMAIINGPYTARFSHMIWDSDQLVPQIDLYKIHHFDNPSKATSLKVLEFNMRAANVEETPIPFGTVLTWEQKEEVKGYNKTDVRETRRFMQRSMSMIAMRERLSEKFNDNMLNCSDVKIGEKIMIRALEEKGVKCYAYIDNKKRKIQTKRESIDIDKIIFHYIHFERYEFQQILMELRTKVITETKGVFEDMVAAVDGLEYKFGTGGLHASVESQIIMSNETHQIVDVDVKGYYPSLGIANRIYPEHLGESFCDAHKEVVDTRSQYAKGTSENEAYKLGGNAAFGNSNNEFSLFLDPQYTMSVTVNGQLMLCMFVEQLIKVPGLRMIQANTDGVTYLCPRQYLDHTRSLARWWEELTKLELEEALYTKMCIRDVNSYLAVKEGGKIKRIGAYAYETAEENPGTRELPWHKDWSFRIIAKAAEAHLVRGENIREFIEAHADIYDFMGRTKVPRSSILEWGGVPVPNVVRYYVSTSGKKLEKVMPAAGEPGGYKRKSGLTDEYYYSVLDEIVGKWLGEGVPPPIWDERIHTKNKSTYDDRRIGIQTGWLVQVCNDLRKPVDIFDDINYDFYIKEAEKICTLRSE